MKWHLSEMVLDEMSFTGWGECLGSKELRIGILFYQRRQHLPLNGFSFSRLAFTSLKSDLLYLLLFSILVTNFPVGFGIIDVCL